jgi:hypothetical protein
LGLLLCQIFGIVAWVMGSADLKEMDAGTMDPSGRGNTSAGKICGMVATILLVLGLVAGLCFLLFGVSLFQFQSR